MKKMKKLVGILLTLAMIVAMSVTAFAEEGSAGSTCTITAPNNGHTYEIYQIFTGDYADGVLSNVKWGKNGTVTETNDVDESILTELKNINQDGTSDTEKLAVIEKYAKLDSGAFSVVTGGNSASVPAGYYLIKDKKDSVSGNDVYTLYNVLVAGNVTIIPKGDKPIVVKKLKEKNDTTGKETGWQDGADYDIGDDVPFELTGTLPSNYADYKTYKYVFRDTLSEGLTYKNDAKVYVKNGESETDVTNSFTVNFGTITCNNLKDIENVTITKDSKIVVRYSATLNEYAKYGKQGNPNEVYLEYSNNPNYTGAGENSSTGQTPLDAVIVFTYKLDANKVEPDGENGTKPLKGAGFTLFKIVPGTETGTTLENQIGAEVKGTDMTEFSWPGLDAGKYVLRETTTPAGYNTAADIEFEIVGVYAATTDTPDGVASGTMPELTGLVVKDSSGHEISGDAETGAAFKAVLNETESYISTNVVNKKGTNLPETGGMGTTILYVIGAILVIGAGILLITKKRMNANK